MSDPRHPTLREGDTLHGWVVRAGAGLPNLRAWCWELQHAATGARHLHLSHEAEENAFIASLRTVPADDTGVAHILEHTVLEGSRSYPVKMFNRLRGRTLSSYLNASTFPDRTAYPFATPSAADYEHLLVRYLDAVFHPLLEEEAFRQEGWRLEFQDPEDPATPLVIRGVVYNEMKAALATPEAAFARRFRRELLPALGYARESGGDPAAIPDLTLEGWRDFHRRHYRPANCWSASFGHLPLAGTLRRLDEAFRGFGPGAEVALPPHPELGAPRVQRGTYPAAAPGSPRFAALGWRLCPQTELDETLRLAFLVEMLAGGLSAPLNAALLASGLGPALAPVGFDGSGTRLVLGVGLKGVEAGSAARLEEVVRGTLERLAREGLPPEDLAGALDRFELEIREQARLWGMPWGLSLLAGVMPHWMAGGRAAAALRGDLLLERLRVEAAAPGFLPALIRRWLLDNPERLLLELEPAEGAVARREAELSARLGERRRALDEAGRADLVERARRTAAWRDDDGDLSCMPALDPALLPREEAPPARRERPCPGGRLLLHDQPVNGLAHLRLALPLDPADPDLELADLLAWLARLGHGGRDTAASERRLRALTGGVHLGSHHGLSADGARPRHALMVGLHGLARRAADWLALLGELLASPALHDDRRLGELLRMRQASLPGQVAAAAGAIAVQAAQDALSPLGRASHRAEGLGFLRHLARLEPGPALGERLGALLGRCLGAPGRLLSLCAEEEAFAALVPGVEALLGALPVREERRGAAGRAAAGPMPAPPLRACLAGADGAFLAEAWPAPAFTDPDSPRLALLGHWMKQPLYERVRAAGGAYGYGAGADWDHRVFVLVSRRDPRIAGTFRDFDAVRGLALAEGPDDGELDRARVEALRRLDAPLLPHERAGQDFLHTLHGAGREAREAWRRGLLDATRAEVVEAARRWLGRETERRRVVVCGERHLAGDLWEDLERQVEDVLPAAPA